MKQFKIDNLMMDPRIQPREHLDGAAIHDYAEEMKAGKKFPPIMIFFDKEAGMAWLAHGFHRVEAAKRAGLSEINYESRSGGLSKAILYAASMDSESLGVRRTNADKRRAVSNMLNNPEIIEKYNDREVAEVCGVSGKFVKGMRDQLLPGKSSNSVEGNKMKRKGKDGKSRPATYKKREKQEDSTNQEPSIKLPLPDWEKEETRIEEGLRGSIKSLHAIEKELDDWVARLRDLRQLGGRDLAKTIRGEILDVSAVGDRLRNKFFVEPK